MFVLEAARDGRRFELGPTLTVMTELGRAAFLDPYPHLAALAWLSDIPLSDDVITTLGDEVKAVLAAHVTMSPTLRNLLDRVAQFARGAGMTGEDAEDDTPPTQAPDLPAPTATEG